LFQRGHKKKLLLDMLYPFHARASYIHVQPDFTVMTLLTVNQYLILHVFEILQSNTCGHKILSIKMSFYNIYFNGTSSMQMVNFFSTSILT
jgi:hypothetical protein